MTAQDIGRRGSPSASGCPEPTQNADAMAEIKSRDTGKPIKGVWMTR